MSQSSQRKGWLLARSEALAAVHRAMNALAPSEDMDRRITAKLGWGQVQPQRGAKDAKEKGTGEVLYLASFAPLRGLFHSDF
jgi:hypothetical protein